VKKGQRQRSVLPATSSVLTLLDGDRKDIRPTNTSDVYSQRFSSATSGEGKLSWIGSPGKQPRKRVTEASTARMQLLSWVCQIGAENIQVYTTACQLASILTFTLYIQKTFWKLFIYQCTLSVLINVCWKLRSVLLPFNIQKLAL